MATEPVLVIQQTADADLRRPSPVAIDTHAKVLHGRPDAVHLVGFQRTEDLRVDLLADDAMDADPADLVGMFPVYIGTDGGFFSILQPVTSAKFMMLETTELRNELAAARR